MPRLKKPRPATLDEVRITREQDGAQIESLDGKTSTIHLTLGAAVHNMSDVEILGRLNETLRVQQMMAQNYRHVAVEIPEGKPQVRYSPRGDQWVPRGGVLRCLIDDGGPNDEATVTIDDNELTMREFSSLLKTYAGWGMRIIFVPDGELHKTPTIEVRDGKE